MKDVEEEIVDIEDFGIWIRESKGLWPYSINLYGLIFDEVMSQKLFELVQKYDLIGFQDSKCLLDGNEL